MPGCLPLATLFELSHRPNLRTISYGRSSSTFYPSWSRAFSACPRDLVRPKKTRSVFALWETFIFHYTKEDCLVLCCDAHRHLKAEDWWNWVVSSWPAADTRTCFCTTYYPWDIARYWYWTDWLDIGGSSRAGPTSARALLAAGDEWICKWDWAGGILRSVKTSTYTSILWPPVRT